MRLAVVFTKEDPVRFVSHLDLLRLFQRAFRRAKLPLAYSQGFNPHPLMSFATALSVGFTSRGEYLDVILTEDMKPDEFIERTSVWLPEGVRIVEAFDLGSSRKSLTSAMRSAEYRAAVNFDSPVGAEELNSCIDELLSNEIVVMKKTKGGVKPTDIRPMVLGFALEGAKGSTAVFRIKGVLSAEGGLNPDMLLGEFYRRLGKNGSSDIEREFIELDRASIME